MSLKRSTAAMGTPLVMSWKSTTTPVSAMSAASGASVDGVLRHDQSARPRSVHVLSAFCMLAWVALVGVMKPPLTGAGLASGVLLLLLLPPPQAAAVTRAKKARPTA